MIIPQYWKPHVLKEFELVLQVMRSSAPLDEKLYYYSALFGIVQRVMNVDTNVNLVFLHHTLNMVHSAFQARLQAMSRGAERPITIEDSMLERLIELTQQLSQRIQQGADSSDICKQLINLAFATSGNGYYLFKKGELTL